MLERIELGAEATTYIRSRLSQGNILSQDLLLQKTLFDGGIFWSFLPADMNPEIAQNFRSGGVTSSYETILCLSKFIGDYLSLAESHYTVFEDALAFSDDPLPRSSKLPFFVYNKQIYYYLSKNDTNDDLPMRVITQANSYALVGVLTVCRELEFVELRQDVERGVIQSIVQNVDHILIGAYDGEGILIWSRDIPAST